MGWSPRRKSAWSVWGARADRDLAARSIRRLVRDNDGFVRLRRCIVLLPCWLYYGGRQRGRTGVGSVSNFPWNRRQRRLDVRLRSRLHRRWIARLGQHVIQSRKNLRHLDRAQHIWIAFSRRKRHRIAVRTWIIIVIVMASISTSCKNTSEKSRNGINTHQLGSVFAESRASSATAGR